MASITMASIAMASELVPYTPQPEQIITQKWSKYMVELYREGKAPLLGLLTPDAIEEKAKQSYQDTDRMPSFHYMNGSAGRGLTHEANRREFEKWGIIPRMLADCTTRNLEVNLFGVTYSNPILLAPVGVGGLAHADGELAAARAAAKIGVTYCLSTVATRSIEDVAAASGDGNRWFQLYRPRTPEICLSLLKRAKANGFTTLIVTVDTNLLSWRPADLQNVTLPFVHGLGCQVGTSDPVFAKRYGLEPKQGAANTPAFPYDPIALEAKIDAEDEDELRARVMGLAWTREVSSGLFRDWDSMRFLQDNWDGPIVIKGIQSVSDALKALELGIDGIVVSNHGGRQVDGGIPSLMALDRICASPIIAEAQKSGKFTVLFDSGIRSGSDIIKAMALGAQAVLLGRPFLYGLAIAGEAGVEQVVKSILAEMEITIALAGYKDLSQIQGKREEVVTRIA